MHIKAGIAQAMPRPALPAVAILVRTRQKRLFAVLTDERHQVGGHIFGTLGSFGSPCGANAFTEISLTFDFCTGPKCGTPCG
jgi:hypothetical protein